jgi:CRP/FNR family transcriptional regulator
MQILKYISLISGEIIRKTYLLNSKNLRGRIATVLLDFSENVFQDDSFELPISRKEIAEMIDMTPENVIRILSEFKRDDLIEVKGKFIRIINKKMVRKIMDLG